MRVRRYDKPFPYVAAWAIAALAACIGAGWFSIGPKPHAPEPVVEQGAHPDGHVLGAMDPGRR
jgi:hypothetical protein